MRGVVSDAILAEITANSCGICNRYKKNERKPFAGKMVFFGGVRSFHNTVENSVENVKNPWTRPLSTGDRGIMRKFAQQHFREKGEKRRETGGTARSGPAAGGQTATGGCFSCGCGRGTMSVEVEKIMETKDVILELRMRAGLSQDELAEQVYVTRQAVSRWEHGETTPNPETLKLLSRLFDVSINTLLGSPRQLVCQCCGMPLEDSATSKEPDGSFNEEYCKWCYADGEYLYHELDDLIEVCVGHMANEQFPSGQVRSYLKETLPKLSYWKQHKNLDGAERFEMFKQQLMDEINALHIAGMPKVETLNALVGGYINLEYRLPNGTRVKFLEDGATYLGNQLASESGGEWCFGIAANMEFILVSRYGENGRDPELVVYRKREADPDRKLPNGQAV